MTGPAPPQAFRRSLERALPPARRPPEEPQVGVPGLSAAWEPRPRRPLPMMPGTADGGAPPPACPGAGAPARSGLGSPRPRADHGRAGNRRRRHERHAAASGTERPAPARHAGNQSAPPASPAGRRRGPRRRADRRRRPPSGSGRAGLSPGTKRRPAMPPS